MTQHVVIAGATGEVGKQLTRLASALHDTELHALTRRAGALQCNALHEVVFDYEDSAAYDELFARVPCDVLLLALGSTTAKAGVQGLKRVEREYPVALIDALERRCPQARVGYCSSVGAEQPRGHYLEAKAGVEHRLQRSPLAWAVVRPSLLLCERREFRLTESMARGIAPVWLWAVRTFAEQSETAWKFAPIRVESVARALLNATLALSPAQRVILEGRELRLVGIEE